MARTPKRPSTDIQAKPQAEQEPTFSMRKHEHLSFRKIVLLAGERAGRETNRMNREHTRYENMRPVADWTGINRTSILYIRKHPRDGGTTTPTIDTFQKMADWLAKLDPPLTDENGVPIVYDYLQLIDLNEKAKAAGDAGDLAPLAGEEPEQPVDLEEDDDDDDDEENALLVAQIVAQTLAAMKAAKAAKKAKEKG